MKTSTYQKVCFLMIIFLFAFVGCGQKYNAVIYDTTINWMRTEYITENATRNSLIPESEAYPRVITHIISTQEQFDGAFKEFPQEIIFDKEMLVVYFYTGNKIINELTGDRFFSHKIKDLKVENEEINITILSETLVKGPTGFPPTQQCFVIKMDKVTATSVNVKLVGKS